MEHIGARIKMARDKRGWNQRELARNAGVNHAWIAKLETGDRHNISLDAARKLAMVLGVTIDYLAGVTTTSKGGDAPASRAPHAGEDAPPA